MHPGSMLTRAVAFLLLTASLVVLPPPIPVAACLPPPTLRPGTILPPPTATPTIQEAATRAQVIFRGHPVRWEDAAYKFTDTPATRTTFAVDTLWKGPPMSEVTVFTFSCTGDANPFRIPGAYIVYANPGGPNGDHWPLEGMSRAATPYDREDEVLGPGIVPPTISPDATRPPSSATPTIIRLLTPVATPVLSGTRSAVVASSTPPAGVPGTPDATHSPPSATPTLAPLLTPAPPSSVGSSGVGAMADAGGPGVWVRAILGTVVVAAVGGMVWVVLARRHRRHL